MHKGTGGKQSLTKRLEVTKRRFVTKAKNKKPNVKRLTFPLKSGLLVARKYMYPRVRIPTANTSSGTADKTDDGECWRRFFTIGGAFGTGRKLV